jgi:DNA-binding transcriptional LysR family regulator
VDQLRAIRAFVEVVQAGGFSAAARAENTSQATVSKRVAALEEHLGVNLMRRSSREQSLTQAGAEYYEKCLAILAELEEAEATARSQIAVPRGLLRVTGAFPLARLLIAPVLPKFLMRYPEIRVDLALTDKHVDLIAEGIDLAVRAQRLPDSNLIARKLFDNPMFLVASPSYFEERGTPQKPKDLAHHNCLIYSRLDSVNIWHFTRRGRDYSVTVTGNLQCDNGDTLLEAAIAGLGLIVLPYWMIHSHLDSGLLQIVMPDYAPQPLPIHAVYPQRRYLPVKVRTFVEFLAEEFATNPALK